MRCFNRANCKDTLKQCLKKHKSLIILWDMQYAKRKSCFAITSIVSIQTKLGIMMTLNKLILLVVFLSIFISCSPKKIVKENNLRENDLKIESFNFFLGSEVIQNPDERVYNNTFALEKVNYVWYDFIVRDVFVPNQIDPKRNKKNRRVIFKEIWINLSEGVEISSKENVFILPDTKNLFNYSAGFSNYPNWSKGKYLLKFLINGIVFLEKEFVIK